MPSQMRYVFGVISSGQIVEEIPVQSVQFDRKLSDWGTFRGSFKLDQSGKSNADLVDSTVPGKCFITVERDGVVVWDGIVWSRTYQSQAKDVEFTARGWETWPDLVKVDSDFTRTQIEQRNIFVDLWNIMQAQPGVPAVISIPGYFPDIVLKDLTIGAKEYKTFLSQMQQISDGDNGFDWTISTNRGPDGRYQRTLVIGYPIIGSADAASATFDYPGQITNYYQTESMANGGTNFYGLGAGEGDSMLTSEVIYNDLLASGFPRYDQILSYKDITSQTNLAALTSQAAVQRRAPLTVCKAFVKGDLEPVFGSYSLGNNVTIAFNDPRHPDMFTTTARLISWSYKPAQEESSEEAELVFEGDQLNDSAA